MQINLSYIVKIENLDENGKSYYKYEITNPNYVEQEHFFQDEEGPPFFEFHAHLQLLNTVYHLQGLPVLQHVSA